MTSKKLFETALGIVARWYVADASFDAAARKLTIRWDCRTRTRFALSGGDVEHPVHDTVVKRYRHGTSVSTTACWWCGWLA